MRCFLLALVLTWALANVALAEASTRRLGLGVGPAFWLELGSEDCRTDPRDVTTCTSALREWYGGLRLQVDYDLSAWLRVGGQLGLGAHLEAYASEREPFTNESTSLRRWLVPMGVQLHAHREPRPGLSLWIGPEVLYALRVDELVTDRGGASSSGDLPNVLYAETGDTREVRSGLMAGISAGLDARLAPRVWLGSEIALAISFVEAGQVGTFELKSVVTAMLRTGFVLRVLF
jgi:hypothetical protein